MLKTEEKSIPIHPFWKIIWQYLLKTTICKPYNAPLLLLGVYPTEICTYVHQKMCTKMSISCAIHNNTEAKNYPNIINNKMD